MPGGGKDVMGAGFLCVFAHTKLMTCLEIRVGFEIALGDVAPACADLLSMNHCPVLDRLNVSLPTKQGHA